MSRVNIAGGPWRAFATVWVSRGGSGAVSPPTQTIASAKSNFISCSGSLLIFGKWGAPSLRILYIQRTVRSPVCSFHGLQWQEGGKMGGRTMA